MKRRTLAFLVLALAWAPAARANTPWPDGCTLTTQSVKPALQVWLQQGLDAMFLGACHRHDLCYGRCNAPDGPYLGNPHKFSCDATFLLELEEACLVWGTALTFPLDEELVTFEDWLTYCNGVLAPSLATVVTVFGDGPFRNSQCDKGCNPSRCNDAGRSLPSTCGYSSVRTQNAILAMTQEPSYCYYWYETSAPPPDPDPLPLPLPLPICTFVNCCSWDPLGDFCCGWYDPWSPFGGRGGCWGGDPWNPWNPWEPWGPWPWEPWLN